MRGHWTREANDYVIGEDNVLDAMMANGCCLLFDTQSRIPLLDVSLVWIGLV